MPNNHQQEAFNHLKNGFIFAGVIGIPLLYLYNLLMIYGNPQTMTLPVPLQITGFILAVTGILLWIVSMYNLRRGFGVLPQKQKRVKTGLYHYMKHPMYVGIIMTFIGLSMSNASREGFLFTVIIMVPILVLRSYFEEKALRD